MSGRGRAKLLSARDSLEAELIASGGEGVLITEARRTVLTQQPLQLLQKLKEGTFSAVAVLEAFQAKVSIIFLLPYHRVRKHSTG